MRILVCVCVVYVLYVRPGDIVQYARGKMHASATENKRSSIPQETAIMEP